MGKIYDDVVGKTENPVEDMIDTLLSVGSLVEERDGIKFRDDEISRIYNIMDKSNFRTVLLVGDYGCGRRSIIEGYVKRLHENMRGDQVVEIDFNEILKKAHMSDFGQVINDVFYAASNNTSFEITLVINNIGHLLNLNCYGNTGFSLMNTLISAIEDNNVKVIATTTSGELKTIEDLFGKLLDYFTVIKLKELTKEETKEILDGNIDFFEDGFKIKLPENTTELICNNADKYIKDRPFPGKAEWLMDEVCAGVNNKLRRIDDRVGKIIEDTTKLKLELQESIENNNYEKCDRINKVIMKNLNRLSELCGDSDSSPVIDVDETDVLEAIGNIIGVSMSRLSKDKVQFLKEMPIELKKNIIGQDETVDLIVKNIRRNQLGLRKTSHSAGNFMFIGSTGVGKTYLAKQLAKYLYGSEDNLLRLDMSEFQSEIDVSKLLGSAPGYVGYKESGLLVKGLAKKPETVVLFDEIEKAHNKIFDTLLQLLDEGFITGSDGNKVDASKALIIFTSNIGVKEAKELSSPLGFSVDSEKKKNEKKEKIIRGALKKRFSPEFLNRLDNVCYFNSLDRNTLKSILYKELDETNSTIKNVTGKSVTLSKEVEDWILDSVEKEDNGARPIIRILQQNIEETISDMVIDESPVLNTKKKTLTAKLVNDNIVLK